MALRRKSEEEKAADALWKQEERAEAAARKERQRAEAAERKRQEQIERQRQAFFSTPAGRARIAYERGDQVFQYAVDVMSQQAVIVPMVGGTNSKRTTDPADILNSVCHEGWELVNGSFVFVEQGQESRDKFLASGQNIAVKGTTVGYYLFKRCETNRRPTSNPWEADSSGTAALPQGQTGCPHCGAPLVPTLETCWKCDQPLTSAKGPEHGHQEGHLNARRCRNPRCESHGLPTQSMKCESCGKPTS